MVAGIGDAASPYYNDTVTLQLTDDWQTYTLHLNASDANTGNLLASGSERVLFDMGSDVGEVDIDNVSVVAGHVGTEDLTGTSTTDPTDPVTVDRLWRRLRMTHRLTGSQRCI